MYIVQLSEPPVSAYEGGLAGHAATRAASGQKVDASQGDVAKYKRHLASRQDDVLSAVGGGVARHNYGYVFNGFAAELTAAQAQQLAGSAGVLSVVKDELHKPTTATTPAFLELTGRDGFWQETGARGEDVVIGVIDSGIWPEHPSFSDHGRHDGRGYGRLRGWNGECQTGVKFTAADCSRKLIGARYYNAGFGGDDGVLAEFPDEFISPRDYAGHGTHTASTAGGNAGVPTTGAVSIYGKISGMAPRARIAAYKVCWGETGNPAGGCYSSDLIAAIDQAVADGVDVINFSISGSRSNLVEPVELALMRAADAGVFVAAAAGNNGPATGTVEHPSPWVTTVAAGTHNRTSEGTLALGNGASYVGASASPDAVAATPLIDATAAALAGADPVKVALCFAAEDNDGVAVLDPAKVAGRIVVCDRGTNARVAKSFAVRQAGGVGMVLLNVTSGSLDPDDHFVPTVHLQSTVRQAVKTYAAGTASTAAISRASVVLTVPAPYTAVFSSRGPSAVAFGDLLKPDLIAPGQSIVAAVAPPGNGGELFGVYSGTSMSTPHVAGIAALLKELHPKWSPMAIKSALMTSAGNVLDGPDTSAAVIFNQGAGHVRPASAAEPGLVFDSGLADWMGFLCGTQLPAATCTAARIPPLDPSDLNVASIAIGDLAGSQTITRRVTNVSGAVSTYTASTTGMPGVDVAISPSSLTLGRGQTRAFRVTFTRTTASRNAFVGGQLTWNGGSAGRKAESYAVRVPMVVRPVALSAPLEVNGTYAIKFGYSGPFTVTPRGLVPAATHPGSISEGDLIEIPVTVPAGTSYARFALFDADVTPGTDLDMEVVDPAGEVVGGSGNFNSAEVVNLVNPAPGTYTVRVIGFSVPGALSAFKLFSWSLGSGSANNLVPSAPPVAVTARRSEVRLAFGRLQAGTKYLGAVVYGGSPDLPGPTFVRVDP